MPRYWYVFCVAALLIWTGVTNAEEASSESEEHHVHEEPPKEDPHKLMVIMIDGFRWDYYDTYSDELPGFSEFIANGARAEYVVPTFPADSLPGWTTLSTGVYPETHGILGNYMFDLSSDPSEAIFDFTNNDKSSKLKWWQNVEPIWTTATRYGKNVFLRDWSRCDVPVREVLPKECTPFTDKGGMERVAANFQAGLEKLKDFDLVMVYSAQLDLDGHNFGPSSEQVKQGLIAHDKLLSDLMSGISEAGMTDKVNIIIVGDHGMAEFGETSGYTAVQLDTVVDARFVKRFVGYGGSMAIAPWAKKFDAVYQSLTNVTGIDVYKREDIPQEYHYRMGSFVQDILIVAKPKYNILPVPSTKQIPVPKSVHRTSKSTSGGSHGFTPNQPEMRTVFFARGPAFKQGVTQPPIHITDIYQLYPKLLGIPAQPNNGTWSNVSGMLSSGYSTAVPLSPIHLLPALALFLVNLLILRF